MNPFTASKILCHPLEIYDLINNKVVHPILYEFDLTNKCNHRCPKCKGWSGEKNKDELSIDLIYDLISQIAKFGGKAITYTGGGEPTLHPHFVDAVKFARMNNIQIGLMTNGSMINKELAEFLVKNCEWIRVSLDAWNGKSFKRTHGMNTKEFKKVCSGIKFLSLAKKEFITSCTIGVGFLTDSHTSKGMINASKLVRSLGADYIQFRPFHYDYTPVLDKIEECKKLENENFKILFKKDKYLQIENGVYQRQYNKCYALNFIGIIAANSKMYPCCHLKGIDKYEYGDLRKNSIQEILSSKRKKDVDKEIDFRDCPPLCKLDHYNKILYNITNQPTHVNFL